MVGFGLHISANCWSLKRAKLGKRSARVSYRVASEVLLENWVVSDPPRRVQAFTGVGHFHLSTRESLASWLSILLSLINLCSAINSICILKANPDSGCKSCWATEKLKSSQICDSRSRFSEEEKSEKPSQCRTLFDRAFCVRSATCISVHWKLFNEVHSVHSTYRMAPSDPGQQLLLSSEIYLQISNFVQTLNTSKFEVLRLRHKFHLPTRSPATLKTRGWSGAVRTNQTIRRSQSQNRSLNNQSLFLNFDISSSIASSIASWRSPCHPRVASKLERTNSSTKTLFQQSLAWTASIEHREAVWSFTKALGMICILRALLELANWIAVSRPAVDADHRATNLRSFWSFLS